MTKHDRESFDIIQYNAALVITGTIKSTSWERINIELGLKSIGGIKIMKNPCPVFVINISKGSYYLNRWINTQPDTLRKIYWQLFLQKHSHLAARSFLTQLTVGVN